MAQKSTPFTKSRYFSLHPNLNREILIRNLLLPELKKQGVLGLGSPGIELPTGEFIALSEAKEMIFDYLINEAGLGERDQRTLRGLIRNTSFVDLASSYLNREITEPRTLGATILPDRITDLQSNKSKPLVNDAAGFSSDQTIRDYNALYQKILLHSNSGNSAQILARLFPGGVSASTNIKQIALAQVIVANLARLDQASRVSSQPDEGNYAVAQEFSRILKNHPELEGYQNFLGSDTTQSTLRQYVDSVVESAKHDNPNILEELDQSQLAYGKKLNRYLLNESELRDQIYNALPLIRDDDRITLTNQILRGSTRGSLDSVSLQEVLNQLQLDQDLQTQVYTALHNQGVDVSLAYHQGKIRVQLDSHYLTSGEMNLLKKGINPFLTTSNPHDDKLVNKEKDLLTSYNSKATNTKKAITLQEAYLNEQQKASPDVLFLIHSRDILNRQRYYDYLSPGERGSVESTRFGRWFSNTTSRIHNAQDKFVDSVYDLTDTVTGKKWLYQQFDKLDVAIAKIKLPGTQIPLFRINTWVATQWNSWKKAKTLSLISSSSSWTSPLGKFGHARLKDYKLGGFTIKGATFVGLNRAWSKLAYKASAGIVKKGALYSFRTATRFFLKVGAKTLAKASFKLGQLAASTILSLSGVFTALGIALLIKDIVEVGLGIAKWGWEQLKKIFPTTEGAAAAVITGAITLVTGALATGATFVIGLLAPMILPAVVTVVMVFSIAFGGLYLFTHLGGDGFNMSINLDSGVANIVAIAICDQSTLGNSSATANVALCIAELAAECPGINPMTESVVKSQSWQCFVGGIVFKKAVAQLEQSSRVKNSSLAAEGNVQCVGLSAASAADGDGAFHRQTNACLYATDVPPGYRYLPGCPGMQPGDHFIMGADNCWSDKGNPDGTVGHIGVIIDPNVGVGFSCVDANYLVPGQIRGPSTGCVFAKSKISGCLRKS